MPTLPVLDLLDNLIGRGLRWLRGPEPGPFYERPGLLGLVWVDQQHARGVYQGRLVEIDKQPPNLLRISLRGPHPGPQRAQMLIDCLRPLATIDHRVGADPRLWGACGDGALCAAAVGALQRLADLPEGELSCAVLVDQEPEVVLSLMLWMADQLGWPSEGQALQVASTDRSARVRRAAWEGLLGGWQPSLAEPDLLPSVRLALSDEDPWIRALCALHAGEEGDTTLLEVLRSASCNDPLRLAILSRRDPGLTEGDWLSVLAHQPDLLHVETRKSLEDLASRVLAERGGREVLASLRALSRERTSRGRAAARALRAIVARLGAGGEVSIARVEGGGLSVSAAGGLSERGGLEEA